MSGVTEAIKQYVFRAIENRTSKRQELVPSAYWIDFARNFSYVFDLTEKELNRIRFHTYHLTSDIYLTYYFAGEPLKSLLETGYRYFTSEYKFNSLEEGADGIGIETEFGRISHDLLRYLGVASDCISAGMLDSKMPKVVLELGGGYGGLARAHLSHNSKVAYFICDLEETIFFSAVYLSKHIGNDNVHLVESTIKSSEVKQGHIYIVAQSEIECLDEMFFDYAISQQSLQEMTQQQVERYLRWMAKHASYLYSCNIVDHGGLATKKNLVLDLPGLLRSNFSGAVWRGMEPSHHERFGDNHLIRAVYKCR